MAKSSVKLDTKAVQAELKKKQIEYTRSMQISIAQYLDLARITAADDFILNNRTGLLNPFMSRKRQPSHPRLLTSRTGKLRWALKEKAEKDSSKNWGGTGKLYKLNTAALNLLVRRAPTGKKDDYQGTSRISINYMPSRLTSVGTAAKLGDDGKQETRGFKKNWMPRETRQTMRARFFWEIGVRGKKRQFLDPAARQVFRKLNSIIDTKVGQVWAE